MTTYRVKKRQGSMGISIRGARRVLLFAFAIILAVTVVWPDKGVSAATSTGSMTIHAIYQGIPKVPAERLEDSGSLSAYGAGDAVLIESQGKFLLMDVGSMYSPSPKYNVDYLKPLVGTGEGQKELSVYLSHFHEDHIGGLDAILANFKVTTLYLPRKADRTATDADGKQPCVSRWNAISKKALKAQPDINIIQLSQAAHSDSISSFSVGDVNFTVIGPVGKHKLVDPKGPDELQRYINNMSLVTMAECGGVKYLTGGDIYGNSSGHGVQKGEEMYLASKYKAKLKADIFKLNHHGLRDPDPARPRSNSETFLKYVRPAVSFVTSKGDFVNAERDSSKNDGKRYPRSFNSMRMAQEYGLCYSLRSQASSFIVEVKNGRINLFEKPRGGSKKQLSGFVKLPSIYAPKSSKSDVSYYVRKSFEAASYRSKKAGSSKNNWIMLTSSWKKINGYKRYFGLTGGMLKGFNTVGKYKYYFSSSGRIMTGMKTIGKYKYYFNKYGRMVKGLYKVGKYRYYFDKNGRMVKAASKKVSDLKKVVIKGKAHYFNHKGYKCNSDGKVYVYK